MDQSISQQWTEEAAKLLQDNYWHSQCVVLELDDGTLICPLADDEGNDTGALFGNSKEGEWVLPVIRQ